MTAPLWLLALVACVPDVTSAQGAATPTPADQQRFQSRQYAVQLPAGWRQLTPDQSRKLDWPADVERLVNPGLVDRFGPVDGWLHGGFDGTCLTVFVQTDGEPPMTEETLRRIQAKFTDASSPAGLKFSGTPVFTTLGATSHPAIECELTVHDAKDTPLSRKLVFIVPTAGRTLWFYFRSSPDAYDQSVASFRQVAATITVPAPPEGPVELTDKLKMPLLVGGLIGLIMLVLYKMNRG